MKTRKVILNDNGKPMTPTQARREVREYLLKEVLEGYQADTNQINRPLLEIYFDGTVDADAEITLRDLLELACR